MKIEEVVQLLAGALSLLAMRENDRYVLFHIAHWLKRGREDLTLEQIQQQDREGLTLGAIQQGTGIDHIGEVWQSVRNLFDAGILCFVDEGSLYDTIYPEDRGEITLTAIGAKVMELIDVAKEANKEEEE